MANKKEYNPPDQYGYFGEFGGQYVPEILRPALNELEEAYYSFIRDPHFQDRFQHISCIGYTKIARPR